VPLPLSVTPESAPRVVATVTVPPDRKTRAPDASRSSTVIAEVDVPFAWMLVCKATMVEAANEMFCGAGETAAVCTMETPPMTAVTVVVVPPGGDVTVSV
jgi:hypothetical protein